MTKLLDGWTIAFDLDGTLVNTAPDLVTALNHVLTQNDLEPVDLDKVETMIGHGARAMIVKGMEYQGVSPDEVFLDQCFRTFLDYYSDHIAVHSHPFEGTETALDALSEAGAILSVCTNKTQALSDRLLCELGLADRFAAIVGADSVPNRKPDGDHLIRAVAAAGGDPARAMLVGDSRTDERAARNAGLPFIFVPFGYESETAQQIGADAVLTHYSDLLSVVLGLAS